MIIEANKDLAFARVYESHIPNLLNILQKTNAKVFIKVDEDYNYISHEIEQNTTTIEKPLPVQEKPLPVQEKPLPVKKAAAAEKPLPRKKRKYTKDKLYTTIDPKYKNHWAMPLIHECIRKKHSFTLMCGLIGVTKKTLIKIFRANGITYRRNRVPYYSEQNP
jgi:hypothetical protein